jgi:hypothetical protein
MIWKKAKLTRDLYPGGVRPSSRGAQILWIGTDNDRFDMAMLAVKSTENASKIICSLRPNLDSLKYPSFNSPKVPTEAKVVCRHVRSQGNLNC